MSLDADETHQIVLHIYQDAAEKAEEINVKTRAKLEDSKSGFLQEGKEAIDKTYEDLEKSIAKECTLNVLLHKNACIVRTVTMKYLGMCETFNAAKSKIPEVNKKLGGKYADVLASLMIEGLCSMMDTRLRVMLLKEDHALFPKMRPKVEALFFKITRQRVNLQLLVDFPLPEQSLGGVILVNQKNTVLVDNTLERRFAQVIERILPCVSAILFQPNPKRKEIIRKMRAPHLNKYRADLETMELSQEQLLALKQATSNIHF